MKRKSLILAIASWVLFVGAWLAMSDTWTVTYPSPAGVYRKLITTAQTILARDGGSVVIGANPPGLVYGGGGCQPTRWTITTSNPWPQSPPYGTYRPPLPGALCPGGRAVKLDVNGYIAVNDVWVKDLGVWLSTVRSGFTNPPP